MFRELCSKAERYGAGEPFRKGALADTGEGSGTGAFRYRHALNNLASVLANKGDRVDAEPLYRRAIAIRERLPESDRPAAMANLGTSLYNLGTLSSTVATPLRGTVVPPRDYHCVRRSMGPTIQTLQPL